ncbi:TetR/AcrR family transcriptional regulator [Nocardioides sp. LHG3406-4]|uniref:TetR/AcrR family transcriptional regulator n=1 Tax=Nocardioides sp. LHG3406-4 TaxID=2804575 RepID=UPI003CF957EA
MSHVHSGSGDISRSLALMWEYDDRAGTRGPKPKLSVVAIVDAAVAVADAEGLDAVSMRRVAADLGVGTMSLYRYVPGKEELLDLMLESVSEMPDDVSLGDAWRPAMETMGRSLWELYTTHRWLPLVDQSRPLLGPNMLRGFEVAVAALAGLGLTAQEQVAIISAIGSFTQSAARTHNSAAVAEERTGVSNEEFWKAQEPVLVAAMESGRFPHMAALGEDAFDMTGEAFFEFGLQLLLDGFGALVERRTAGS